MKIKDLFRKSEKRSLGYALGLGFNSLTTYTSDSSMQIAAVYCAVTQISNAVACLPFSVLRQDNQRRVMNDLDYVLNIQKNGGMNHFNLIKTCVQSVLLQGEAFIHIVRENGVKVKALEYVPTEFVNIIVNPDNTLQFSISGKEGFIDEEDMVHLFMWQNPITKRGKSVIGYARECLEAASNSNKSSDEFYKSGGNLSGIIRSSATLNKEQKTQIAEAWKAAFQNNGGAPSVAILPAGLEYQPISIKPADAEFLESRKFNVIEIARFFNISPLKLFDMRDSNYNALETSELSFLKDTVLPYIRMIEDEFTVKLLLPSEKRKYMVQFNLDKFLMADKKAEAEYYKVLLQNGILTINEARTALRMPLVDDKTANSLFMQLNMASVENVYKGTNLTGNKVDNKVVQKDNNNNKEN